MPGVMEPRLYWNAAIGHLCHVSVGDVEWLTPAQLLSCAESVHAVTS